MLLAVAVLLGASAVVRGAALDHHQQPNPTVNTSLGWLVGVHDGANAQRFAAIPYAVPPLGRGRFARAVEWTQAWEGTRDATAFAPPCVQNPQGDPNEVPDPEAPPPSEDCLYLNVWRPQPRANDTKPKAVMAWVFGGGLCSNAPSNRFYNGSVLAGEQDVVVVSFNFRLGALGFLVADDFPGEGNGGMNGMSDMVTALRWVQHHIHSFGGDPSRVTLFGQSSGGYSVCTLLVAPAAKGLFHRAIVQSGPCVGGWGPANADAGRALGREVMQNLGVSSLEQLRGVDAEKVQWPDEVMTNLTIAPYFSGYFVDEGLVPDQPARLFAEHKTNLPASSIMIGFTSKDGTSSFYGTAPTLPSSEEKYEKAVNQAWGKLAPAVLAHYPLSAYNNNAPSAFVQADADEFVVCPLLRLARTLANATSAVEAAPGSSPFVYEYAHFASHACDVGVTLNVTAPAVDNATRGWASHGNDVWFVFGTTVGPNSITYARQECPFTNDEAALSRAMRTYWASFAACGTPNCRAQGALPEWPAYCGDGGASLCAEHVMRFGTRQTDGWGVGVVDGLRTEGCRFWDAVFRARGSLI